MQNTSTNKEIDKGKQKRIDFVISAIYFEKI